MPRFSERLKALAQGAGSAQGIQFNPVELETRCNVTNVMYINAKAVGDQKNKDTKKVNGEDEQPVESSSDDDIPLVELQRRKERKSRRERVDKVLEEAASDNDFKENEPPAKKDKNKGRNKQLRKQNQAPYQHSPLAVY